MSVVWLMQALGRCTSELRGSSEQASGSRGGNGALARCSRHLTMALIAYALVEVQDVLYVGSHPSLLPLLWP